ncbi:hypothetical protein KCM76_12325 [Zooshikella marina]|uniref:hypothetical protein n=1 Tax=Zooshikella ganghwensis TaxID=202772 RepID=UPI001BAFD518|nr:hypothetical protein [Zooshikella ganghwensis]MBU2706771.1 hypothetical protein [Zooshikella ganghwensis]
MINRFYHPPEASLLEPPTTSPEKQHSVPWYALLGALFLPSRFLKVYSMCRFPKLVFVASWLLGMTVMVDIINRQMLEIQLGGPFSYWQTIMTQWFWYWLCVAAVGLPIGIIVLNLGCYWVRWGIIFCGTHLKPSYSTMGQTFAKELFILPSLITSLPIMLLTIYESCRYSMYIDAWAHPVYMVEYGLVVLPAWSIWITYQGVRTFYKQQGWRAVCWFLVLPGCFYLSSLFAMLMITLLQIQPERLPFQTVLFQMVL